MKTNPDLHRILQKPNALSFYYKLNLNPLTSPNDYFLSYETPLLWEFSQWGHKNKLPKVYKILVGRKTNTQH